MDINKIQPDFVTCCRVTAHPLANSNRININVVCERTKIKIQFFLVIPSPLFPTYPTQYIENIAGCFDGLVANTTCRISYVITEYAHQTDELQYQTERKQFCHRMLLYSHRVNLHRHQYQIDEKEYQIHFQYILLIEREVEC